MVQQEWSKRENLKAILHNCRAHTRFMIEKILSEAQSYRVDYVKNINGLTGIELERRISAIEAIAIARDYFSDEDSTDLVIWSNAWLVIDEALLKEDAPSSYYQEIYDFYKTVEHEMGAEQVKVCNNDFSNRFVFSVN